MSGEVVYKMTGSGNDFVFVDGRRTPSAEWPAARIRRICHRRLSVGADGLAVLEPGRSMDAVRFHFFNSDGSRAEMCGNAALCATRLAAWLRMAPAEGMRLETDAGVYRTRCLPDAPHLAEIEIPGEIVVTRPDVPPGPGELEIGFARVGVPHLVVLVEDVGTVDVPKRGRELRYDRRVGAGGANVNFVARGRDGWAMRTYERGVEAETLACGTGAVACAASMVASGHTGLPWRVRTASGVALMVQGAPGTARGEAAAVLAHVALAGEGRLVCRIVLAAE